MVVAGLLFLQMPLQLGQFLVSAAESSFLAPSPGKTVGSTFMGCLTPGMTVAEAQTALLAHLDAALFGQLGNRDSQRASGRRGIEPQPRLADRPARGQGHDGSQGKRLGEGQGQAHRVRVLASDILGYPIKRPLKRPLRLDSGPLAN